MKEFKEKILLLFVLISCANIINAQKIVVKNISGKPVDKASVVVQVNYKATNYIFDADKEKLFSMITDTTGVVELKGEFQNGSYEVKSVAIKIKHTDYSDYNITTLDYSSDPKFSYNIYLTPQNRDVNIKTMPAFENNGIDIYSCDEVAKKLNLKVDDIIIMIEKGELKGKKIGEKYFVSGNELRKYLEN